MKNHISKADIQLKKWSRSLSNTKGQRDLRKWWRESQKKNSVPEMKKFNSAVEKAMNTKVDIDLNEFLRFAITVQRRNGSFYYTIFNGITTNSSYSALSKSTKRKLALETNKLDMSDSMTNLYWLREFLINALRDSFEKYEIKVSRKKMQNQIYSLTGKELTTENIIPSGDYSDRGIYDKNK